MDIKLIFDNNFVITEHQKDTNGQVFYYAANPKIDSIVDFGFGAYAGKNYSMTIEDARYESIDEANYSFVLEKVKVSDPLKFDCKKNAHPSLAPLITRCFGPVLLRKLTKNEKKQIEEFKKDQEGNCLFTLGYRSQLQTQKFWVWTGLWLGWSIYFLF